MGWISDRKMKTGSGVGGRRRGRAYPKDGAPLRAVVVVIRPATSLFDTCRVKLACGHETESWGGIRARCAACKETP